VKSPKRGAQHLRGLADARAGSGPYRRSKIPVGYEEVEMAVAMMVDNPNGSQEIYERLRALIGLERPAGGIFHLAGPSPDGGWRVIEVWESEEDAKRFFEEHLLPAAEAVGAPAPPAPQVWKVHNYMA
jgi:hypothetical protein